MLDRLSHLLSDYPAAVVMFVYIALCITVSIVMTRPSKFK